ncbi:hypothetical protein ACPA9J_22455 [Pseudomonas aeruginosa]
MDLARDAGPVYQALCCAKRDRASGGWLRDADLPPRDHHRGAEENDSFLQALGKVLAHD